jgi:hypothetical protein
MEAGDLILKAGFVSQNWVGTGRIVFLLFLLGKSLMLTAAVCSAIGLNAACEGRWRACSGLKRAGHDALCVDDRSHHRDNGQELSQHLNHLFPSYREYCAKDSAGCFRIDRNARSFGGFPK